MRMMQTNRKGADCSQVIRRSLGAASRAAAFLFAFAAAGVPARGADGTWIRLVDGDASGLWSDPTAWSGGTIADGAGFTANFSTLDITLPSALQLDTPRTIGNLIFGDADPTTPATWTFGNNLDPLNVLTFAGTAPTLTVNGGAGSSLTLGTVFAGTAGLTITGNSPIFTTGNVGHSYTGGTVLRGRVETTNLVNAVMNVFGAAVPENAVTFDGGYFRIFNTQSSTSAGTLVNNLIVETTGTIEYSGRSNTSGTLTGNGTLNVITHYVRSDNSGNWSGFTGTINVTSGDAGVSDFRQTTYNGFAGATLHLDANSNLYFTANQAANGSTAVSIGALSGVSSATLRGGPVAGRVTSFQIGVKNSDSTFAGAIETDLATNRLSNVVKNGTGTLTLTGVSSAYTGPTTINAGTLAVAALANGSAVSSIGRSANLASNLVIDGGTLRYIGAGSSTDRLLTVGINGATLDASGTGAVNFTGGGAIALAGLDLPRMLTFAGSQATPNPFTPSIPDSGIGATAIVKTGTGTWALNALNSYTGTTTINGGVLAVDVLANGGAPSGIGQSTSAVTNLVLDGGALRYTGTGASTDRAITLGAAGGTLDASGGGALTFSNPLGIQFATADAPRALTLAGTNNALNTLAAAIGNSGNGATSLVKNGSGTWVLAAANSYTGSTTIHGGTLKASNTTGSATGPGSVTVNSGGALGGAGSVSGLVTVNNGGHIAPGDGVGTLTVGNLSLSPGSIFDFEFNAPPLNDRVTVSIPNGLAINGGGFNLFTEGTTTRWTTPGTYNLLQFSGTLGGAGTGALSILNPQSGLSYAFGNANGFITLSITATSTLSDWLPQTGGSWATIANWSSGIPNGQSDAARFLNALTSPGSITLDGDKRVGTIQFNNTNAYTIAPGSGGTLILDSGADGAQIAILGGTHRIEVPLTLASSTAIDVNNPGDTLTITGSIGGAGMLTKNGPGTLALSGTNTFANGTALRGGAVQIGTNSALGTATLTFAGSATLRAGAEGLAPLNPVTIGDAVTAVIDTLANTFNLRGVISNTHGNGALIKSGSGALTLGDANTYGGSTAVNGGVLAVGALADGGLPSSIGQSTSSAASLILDGATLRYTGATTATDRLFRVGTGGATIESAGAGPITFSNPGALTFAGTDVPRTITLAGANNGANTFAPIVGDNGSGATSLTKNGAGTWFLSGANNFSGETVIAGGTLALANSLALQNSTLNYNNQGGMLSFDMLAAATVGTLAGAQPLILENSFAGAVTLTVGANNGSTTYAGALSGTGSLVKVGGGVLSLGGQNVYTGTTTVAAGGGVLKLLVTDALSPANVIMVNNAGGLQLGNGVTLSSSVTAAVGANEFIDVPDADAVATLAGAIGVAGGGNQFRLGISGVGATLNVTGAINILNAATIAFLTRGNLVFGGSAQLNAAPGMTIGRSNQALNVLFKENATATIAGATGFGGNQANPNIALTLQDSAAFDIGVNGLDLNASSAAINQTAINLNGGTLTAGAFFKTSIADTQLTSLNLNGGILRAGASSETFLPALPGLTVNVQTGGARIDTNGFDITIAHSLTHDPVLPGTDGGLRKSGQGALFLAGDNSYTGATIFDAGRTILSGTLSATASVAINGGSLELGASDRVNDLATVTLAAGATLGSAGFSETFGVFALSGNATVDLGNGASLLRFANSSSSTWSPGTLTISGWSGSLSGGGMDQLLFGSNASGLNGAQIAQIQFLDPAGFASGIYGARILDTGELVAIPEPVEAALSFAGLATLLGKRRRVANPIEPAKNARII